MVEYAESESNPTSVRNSDVDNRRRLEVRGVNLYATNAQLLNNFSTKY